MLKVQYPFESKISVAVSSESDELLNDIPNSWPTLSAEMEMSTLVL